MLTCDFIAKYLKKRGVKQVFGTPGSDTISLINAFSDQGINYVLTHHENTAAYMAGGLNGIGEVALQLQNRAGDRQVNNTNYGIVTGYGMTLYRYGGTVSAAILEGV